MDFITIMYYISRCDTNSNRKFLRRTKMITHFDGKYEFLSNFFYSPFVYDDVIYPTNEHFFQAMKTLSQEERRQIAEAKTPGVAKHMGRRVQLREDWEEVKEDVMRLGVELKFRAHQGLAERLINTGDEELVEGTLWHDNEWGNCTCPKCQNIPGKNKLGKILMERRDILKKEKGLS